MSDVIVFDDAPDPSLRDAILRPLLDYNASKIGPQSLGVFAFFIKEPATNKTVGGLWARDYYDWVFIENLFVPDIMRGQGLGSRLLSKAEALAKERGRAGIWLDTFSFQARGFYEKLGYKVFGELPDYPGSERRYFLQKRL